MLTNFLKSIAVAIRTKENSTGNINAKDFATRILALPSGGAEGGATGVELPGTMAMGSFALENESAGPVVIEHSFPSKPIVVIFLLDTVSSDMSTIAATRTVGGIMNGRNEPITATSTQLQYTTAVQAVTDVSAAGFTLNARGANYPFLAGTYHWIAWC